MRTNTKYSCCYQAKFYQKFDIFYYYYLIMFTNFTDNCDIHSKGGARGHHIEQIYVTVNMVKLAGYPKGGGWGGGWKSFK